MEVRSLYVEPPKEAEERDWPALQFLDVFRIFTSGPTETVALRGLSLEVGSGKLVAVRGPSGCGKSTLLHLAAGLDQPSAGEVRFFGRALGRMSEQELASYRARNVAVVFQRGNLWPSLTAQENLETTLRLSESNDPSRAAREALEQFGLGHRRTQRAATLSGGEQQRIAIASAAARGAPLVLADEPTGELDSTNEKLVIDALHRLRDDHGTTVVIVTHSVTLAEQADAVIEMRDGMAA
ncbi:MAG: putative transport system ATP-binding protein [Gaiellales bacterium]|jgi:putative ABC transport system ATP-binding protein|nr:putative transport system ATP-binding protein [Gaiellales bacterium]